MISIITPKQQLRRSCPDLDNIPELPDEFFEFPVEPLEFSLVSRDDFQKFECHIMLEWLNSLKMKKIKIRVY